MPNFVSKCGELHPAKEKIGLTNLSDKTIKYNGETIKPGDPFVYDGPCREAIKVLNIEGRKNKDGELVLGRDFRTDPDFLKAIVNQNYNRGKEGLQEYLNDIGFDEKVDSENFNKKIATVKAHEVPKKVKAINALGGGKDFSGQGNDVKGDFGDPPNI